MSRLSTLVLLSFSILTLSDRALFQKDFSPDDYLNACLDAKYHKTQPGPEDSLHNQCAPWTNHSCCTSETSVGAHFEKLYDFDYNHCSIRGFMTDQCKRHFIQDTCFYECSPNVGPWFVSVQQSFRRQRFMNVPLCASDCNAWFQDCADDFTCTENWARNFDWKDSRNYCPVGSSCKTFREIYETPENFCEKVWDHSWKVVPDKEPCMRLWFDGKEGNPNAEVAEWKVDQIKRRLGHSLPKNSATVNVPFKFNLIACVILIPKLYSLVQ